MSTTCFVAAPVLRLRGRVAGRSPAAQRAARCRQWRVRQPACATAGSGDDSAAASVAGSVGAAAASFSDVHALPAALGHPPSLVRALRILWRFARPHTIFGSAASVVSMTVVGALVTRSPIPWPGTIVALVAALLMNVYIVGLNQLYDIEIDRVNKPDLPIAAGDLGVPAARRVIVLTLLISLALGFLPAATPALRTVLFGSAALGTAYSLPPIRLKNHALLASVAIFSVRGLLVNSCFYLHAVGAQKLFPLALPPLISAICILFVVFGIVIALLKDVPDIRGDRIFNIRTFSVRIGAKAVFRFIQLLLFLLYAGGAAISLRLAPSLLFGFIAAFLHTVVGLKLLAQSRKVDPEDEKSVYRFYMNVWKAFYFEYAIIPITAF